MADYPLPPWLSPAAAQGWGSLEAQAVHTRVQAGLERDRMAQQSTMASIEAQQRQEQLGQEVQLKQQQLAQSAQQAAAQLAATAKAHEETLQQQALIQGQRIAIDQAYKTSQLSLAQQRNDISQKTFDAKTKDAADRFAATQTFQKSMLPPEEGGEGLSAEKAALKYMAPYMTGTEVGRLSAQPGPFTMGAPVAIPGLPNKTAVQTSRDHFQIMDAPNTATNAPGAIPVPGDSGTIGYWVTPPGGGKAQWQPVQKTSDTDLAGLVAAKKAEAGKTNAPVAAPKAEGGYKLGVVYKGGLRYLGGDPHNESSWEKVK